MCISSNAKGQGLVDSCLLGNSYLESVPRSHYGDKAVVPGYRGPGWRGVPVRRLTAIFGHTGTTSVGQQCRNYGRSQPAIGLHRTQPVPIIHSPQKLHYSGLFRTVPAPSPKVDAPPHLTDRGITRLSTDTIAWLLLYFHQLLRGYTKHMPG